MSTTIPLNDEHLSALQAEIDQRRQDMKTDMTATEVARLEVIEECVAKLEAVKVPFYLWAAHDDSASDCGARKHWWCFHKLTHVSREDMTIYMRMMGEALNSILAVMLDHITQSGNMTIVVHNSETGHPISVHREGRHQFIPRPPPLNDDSVQ